MAHVGEPVLVVEADPAERDRIGTALESAGFDVLTCPGPTEPDYTCVGARDGVCPLVDDASVVVLDMSLDSEALMTGTPAEELLGLYLTSRRPVIVLGSRSAPDIAGELIRLRRHPEEEKLLRAVRELHPATRKPEAPGSR
jgi:DNA-binding response OmpR family regulator